MRRKGVKYNPNVFHVLTLDIKEKLRVAVLEAIFKTLQISRKKTHPPMELLEEFISEDIRRVVERLSDGLELRHIDRQYFILYRGFGGRRAFKLIQVGVEDMVKLKKIIEKNRPDWALRCEAYPLAHHLSDDECFPFTTFWPQVEPYEKVSHASIRFSGS